MPRLDAGALMAAVMQPQASQQKQQQRAKHKRADSVEVPQNDQMQRQGSLDLLMSPGAGGSPHGVMNPGCWHEVCVWSVHASHHQRTHSQPAA